MYNLICQYSPCCKPFERNRKTFQYCSKRCAYDDRIGKPPHPNAGKKRTKKPTVFICQYCYKPFERLVYPSDLNKRTFEFCNAVCRNKARILPDVPCPICGKMFRPRINDTDRHRKKHCSKDCADTAKIGVESPKRTAKSIRDIITRFYPTHGALYLADMLGVSKSSVRNIANSLGVKLNPDRYEEIIYSQVKKYMLENNPMKRQEVRDKVKKYWDDNPDLRDKVTEKLFEGHRKLQRDKPSKLEIRLFQYLDELGLTYEPYYLVKPKFIVDVKIDNIIIQADGDYWHGHPRFEPLTDRQKAQQKRDKAQDAYLEKCGYTVIRVWESDMSYHLVKSLLDRYSPS